LLKIPKCSCTPRTPEREAQASILSVRHGDEPGARARGKGALGPMEEHLSRLLLVLLKAEWWFT